MAEDLTADSVAEEGVSTTAQNAPVNDAFKADPNQFVFDKEHAVDFQVDVVDVYFAEKKEVWESKQNQYQVNSGGTGADVVQKYKKEGRRNITTDVGTNGRLRAHQLVSVNWEEKKEGEYKYEKISKTIIGKKVFVVAKCSGDSGTLKLTILENKLDNKANVYDGPVKFLDGQTEKTVIEFQLDGSGTYQKEIVLRPKEEEDLKQLGEAYEKVDGGRTYLFFKAEVTGTSDETKFPDETKEFLNRDNNRFQIRFCDCGIVFREEVQCTRYGSTYGPAYWGKEPLNTFSKWDEMVNARDLTEDEKTILIAMSENEGNMDAIQSYDSEILTAGAMQKTINPNGYGELPIQIWEFKQDFPDIYDCLLNCGWEIKEEKTETKNKEGEVVSTVMKYRAYYKDQTGQELKNTVRDGFSKDNFGKKVKSEPVEPIIRLVKNTEFQKKQIKDFIKRLRSALAESPTNYSANAISDFVKSNLGKATVLDQSVNRPAHVRNCFSDALDSFFKANPSVSKDPSLWGENSGSYESQILEIYGPLRSQGKYTMTDGAGRFTKLKSKL